MQDILSDRRQMIGYEEEEDRPFDCYGSPPPKGAAASSPTSRPARKKSPSRKTKQSPQPSPRAASSPSSRLSKSRPWRVDVMLKKNKGVERSTVSWKQQMKERRQVFQWSGVTVPEDTDGVEEEEESLFAGLSEDENSLASRGSERAVIGLRPSPSTTPRAREELPGIIDLTAVPEPDDNTNPVSNSPVERSSSVPIETDEAETTAASTPIRDPHHTQDAGDKTCPKRSSGATEIPDEATFKSYSREWTNPATSVVQDLQNAMKVLESPLGSNETSSSPPAIANLHSALEEHGMPCIGGRRRLFGEDDDDSDDGHSVCSVRSIASSHFPSQTERKQESEFEKLRKAVIQELEESFGDYDGDDPFEKYCIVAMGRADPNATGVKPPPKNEYFIAYRRMQRSRLASELKRSVALLPTQHFYVVEKSQQDWKNEAAELQAKLEYDKTGDAMQLLAALSFSASAATEAPPIPKAPTDQTEHSPQVLPAQSNKILVETVTSIDDSMSVETGDEDSVNNTTLEQEPNSNSTISNSTVKLAHWKRSPSKFDHIMVETVSTLSMDEDATETPRGNPNNENEVWSMPTTIIESPRQTPEQSEAKADQCVSQTSEEESELQEAGPLPDIRPMEPDDSGNSETVLEAPSDNPKSPSTQKNPSDNVVSGEVSMQNEATSSHDTLAPEPAPAQAPSDTKTANGSSGNVDGSKKKSKASKWKDRLARRKSSLSNKDSEEETATANDQLPVEGNASAPPLVVTDLPTPYSRTQLSPSMDPSPSTSKGQRKSLKWKERLAKKKKDNCKSDTSTEDYQNAADCAPSNSDTQPESTNVTSSTAETTEATEEAQHAKEISSSLAPAKTKERRHIEINTMPSDVSDEKKEDDPKENAPRQPDLSEGPETATTKTSIKDQPSTEIPTFPNDLQNSFMAFDALLKHRQGGEELNEADADDYSEYTIEETVIHEPTPPAAAQSLLRGGLARNKSFDSETEYEEITVDQSFMELTIEESCSSTVPNTQEDEVEDKSPQLHAATANLMSSRMFSTPKVATEPTITIHSKLSDDDMTQLTFDQSHAPSLPPPTIPDSIPKRPSVGSGTQPKNNAKSTIGCDGSMNSSGRRRSLQASQRSSSSLGKSQRSTSSKGSSSMSSEKQTKRVADLLRKDIWSGDVKVVKKAFDNIVREASKGPDHRSKIVQCGGIMGIVRAMETHCSAEKVQIAGCAALDKMAMDPDTQIVIGEMGGITAILGAMKKFESSEDVQQFSCAALANITRHRGTTDEADGAVPLLCASMTRHSGNMMIQSKSFCAIANLCMDNKYRLKELSEAGGMLAMTMALQKPWPSKSEKHEAISNLSILLRCMAEHEEGEDDEEDEFGGYGDYDEDELEEMMSVVSSIMEDEAMSETEDDQEFDSGVANDGGNDAVSENVPETIGSLQEVSSIKVQSHEQGSNSTQPTTGSTSRDGEDENCVLS